ncbi:hypothetical protein DEA8626_03213 [Defluviimonas aquaemixtae]|uniref:DUF998 domain-containing protein n=1 Tax=Albidovulum aquaemixtae TaxID=1542388 RepID=A0A2R8BLC4_9RHOB|nr:hypothetical protein [Defluviimonas aquaemixtae]SPH24164.1 hypothetical protein DEA8626_03213 [Defluviimonas aquaemixtae]
MTLDFIARAGAAGMIVSGAALGYSYVAHPHHMTPDTIASPGWIAIHTLFAVSLILGLMGTTALYAPTAERSGWLGLAGFATLFVGMMMIFGLDYYEVLIAPFLAVHYPQVIADHGAGDAMGAVAAAFPAAGLLTVIGYALLGWAWLRSAVVPRALGLALIAASLAFGVALSPVGGLMAAKFTATAFGLSLIAVGLNAWRGARHDTIAA